MCAAKWDIRAAKGDGKDECPIEKYIWDGMMPHMRILCPIGMGGFEMCNELKQQTIGRTNALLKKYMGWMTAHMSSINGKDECPIEKNMGWNNAPY